MIANCADDTVLILVPQDSRHGAGIGLGAVPRLGGPLRLCEGVGGQHVWTHDKLRVWFQRYEDDEGIALLLGGRGRRDEPADDEAAFDADYHFDFP
jgi:hypothetical protein